MTAKPIPFNPALKAREAFEAFAVELQGGDTASLRRTVDQRAAGPASDEELKLLCAESLLLDFVDQGWVVQVGAGKVSIVPPVGCDGDRMAEKARIRQAQLVERDAHLSRRQTKEFVASMEQRRLIGGGWHSIYSLMRDGRELASSLQSYIATGGGQRGTDALEDVISPYLQVAEPGVICKHTGLDLGDIWRYFRLTWVNAPKSVPGRSMMLLVRDAAVPNHPVIGIAALGSSVIQQQLRDQWIGWDSETFVQGLAEKPSTKLGRWLLQSLGNHIDGLYVADLVTDGIISRREIKAPTHECLGKLLEEGATARRRHELNPKPAHHKRSAADWKVQAKTDLFRAKRCETLSRLLSIRRTFLEAGLITGTRTEVTAACESKAFRAAVGQLIRINKSEHVGINMMDITVCGAIAPYNHLLGGKLVCSLMFSPEVVLAYRVRYTGQESIIASSMKGAAVHRVPRLVMLATTSLYGIGASQYNRIKIPLESVGETPGEVMCFEKLGLSLGFGSFHISPKSSQLMDILVSRREGGGKKVNRIFGEGVNPRMRMLRQAMELLALPSNALLTHGNQRVVYGIPLARNFRGVLLGLSDRPSYYLPLSRAQNGTSALASFWRKRWLAPRLNRPGILEAVMEHTLSYPVEHGARVKEVEIETGDGDHPWTFED